MSKNEKGLMDNSVAVVGGEWGIRGLKGTGKKSTNR